MPAGEELQRHSIYLRYGVESFESWTMMKRSIVGTRRCNRERNKTNETGNERFVTEANVTMKQERYLRPSWLVW